MNIHLKEILTTDFVKRFQESFALATGWGTVFVDDEGKHLGEGSNFSAFCQAMNSTKEGSTYCAQTNRKAIDLAIKQQAPSIYVCHAGLVNIEIPLSFDGEYVGAITAGQVLCSDPDAYPRDARLIDLPWLHTEEAKQFLKDTRVLTKEQIEATAVSLENIANHIIQTAMYHKLEERVQQEENKLLEYQKRQIEMEHLLKLAELDALQKQVTPHFMFNVLNSVSRLISLERYQTAQEMIDSFSQMLRYSLSSGTDETTLGEEFRYIDHYLSIQKTRFGDRITSALILDEGLESIAIPYFSIQQLVDNALQHGLLPREQGGHLEVRASLEEDRVIIIITDNGVGMAPDIYRSVIQSVEKLHVGGKHIGVANALKRLRYMYEKNFNYTIESSPGKGTVIILAIDRSSISHN